MRFKVEPGDEIVTSRSDGGFMFFSDSTGQFAMYDQWPVAIPSEVLNIIMRIANNSRREGGICMSEPKPQA